MGAGSGSTHARTRLTPGDPSRTYSTEEILAEEGAVAGERAASRISRPFWSNTGKGRRGSYKARRVLTIR